MKDTDYQILSLFRGNPDIEFSTSQLIEKIYEKENQRLNDCLNDPFSDSEIKKKAKQEVSKLHRRLLYHLQKLNDEGILIISKIANKGQKYFSLNIKEGEELHLDKYKRRLVITRPNTPALPFADLEEKKIVFRVEPSHFFDRVNSILVESNNFSNLRELYDFSYNLFSNVNDVIGINNFENIVNKFSMEEIFENMFKLEEDARAYNKRICLIINLINLEKDKKMVSFLESYLSKDTPNTNIIFDTTIREFMDKSEFIKSVIEIFSINKRKLNIKNDDVFSAPYLLGKAGPYCFSKKDWQDYSKNYKTKNKAIINTQSSVIIDIKKIYETNPSAKDLKEAIIKCGHSLHHANTYQRKNSENFFKKINPNSKEQNLEIFSLSKNYIRLWNFELFENTLDNLNFSYTLRELKKELNQFSQIQETIYMSCGMPMNFKVGLSIAYRKFREGFALHQDFDWISITKINDMYKKEIQEKLTYYEEVSSILDGGFEVRFFRKGNVDVLDILREIHLILNSYKFPLICYNFSEQIGSNMKLNKFI